MRTRATLIALAVISLSVAGDEKSNKPLTPESAAKKLNETCTVELIVASTGKGEGVFFLNSKEDFKDAANFTVFINPEGVKSLMEAKIDDPASYYKKKTIQVTGMVKLYREKPEIVVEKADQIKVVEEK